MPVGDVEGLEGVNIEAVAVGGAGAGVFVWFAEQSFVGKTNAGEESIL